MSLVFQIVHASLLLALCLWLGFRCWRQKRALRRIRSLATAGVWRLPGGAQYGVLANIFASIVAVTDAEIGTEPRPNATKEHGDG